MQLKVSSSSEDMTASPLMAFCSSSSEVDTVSSKALYLQEMFIYSNQTNVAGDFNVDSVICPVVIISLIVNKNIVLCIVQN